MYNIKTMKFNVDKELSMVDWHYKPSFKYIVLHHSLTTDGRVVDWSSIRKWHMGLIKGSPYHMSDVGYHLGVELVGQNVEVKIGRPLSMAGAHTIGFNDKAVGICILGSFDKNVPDSWHWMTSLYLIKRIRERINIPIENIIGHRESFVLLKKPVEKTCPGLKFDMNLFRRDVKENWISEDI